MHVITEREYDEAIEEAAAWAFDPMHPDESIAEASMEIVDLALDGENDEAVERLQARVFEAARYHGFQETLDQRLLGLTYLPASALGCIVQHGKRPFMSDELDDLLEDAGHRVTGERPGKLLRRGALMQFYTDVKRETTRSVRAAVGERKQEA